jgi:hypothetical protein
MACNLKAAMLLAACLVACASLPPGALAAGSAVVAETGGSDFVAIGVDPSQLHNAQNWKRNDIFRTPACQYDQNRAAADHQLQAMRASGQRKIGTTLWFMNLHNAQDCSGFVLNSAGGHLTKKVLDNLDHLLKTATTLGFDEVQIRFAPMDGNRPLEWKQWKADTYGENWSLIDSTISAIGDRQRPRVIYDLSAGMGGQHGPNCPECDVYQTRLWSDYLKKYSPKDSYGFSISIAPNRVKQALVNLRQGGGLPSELGITTYHAGHPGIRVAAEEMKAQGVNLPILIQETSYDDPDMYRAIMSQARANGVQIRAIMQWPVVHDAGVNITESTTPAYIYGAAE